MAEISNINIFHITQFFLVKTYKRDQWNLPNILTYISGIFDGFFKAGLVPLTWLLDNDLCGRGVVCVTERCCGTWPVSTVWPSSAALRCGARARAAYQVALAHYVCGARARVMGGAGAMFKSAIILPFVLALDGRPVLRC